MIVELKSGRFFACIDFTSSESPEKDNELRTLHNAVLTPHIYSAVTNGRKRIAKYVCEEMDRLETDCSLQTEVDLSKLSILT